MYDLIDILCMLSGGYLVYAAIVMKRQGRIIKNVVMSKNTDENSIKDKDGFVHYLYGKLILCGCLIILASIVNLVNDHMDGPGIVALITCSIFAVTIVGYGIAVNSALKKYAE